MTHVQARLLLASDPSVGDTRVSVLAMSSRDALSVRSMVRSATTAKMASAKAR